MLIFLVDSAPIIKIINSLQLPALIIAEDVSTLTTIHLILLSCHCHFLVNSLLLRAHFPLMLRFLTLTAIPLAHTTNYGGVEARTARYDDRNDPILIITQPEFFL